MVHGFSGRAGNDCLCSWHDRPIRAINRLRPQRRCPGLAPNIPACRSADSGARWTSRALPAYSSSKSLIQINLGGKPACRS